MQPMLDAQVAQAAAAETPAALLTATAVGRMLGVDPTTIYRMASDGRLAAVRVGKQWRFRAEDVAAAFPGAAAVLPSPSPAPAAPSPRPAAPAPLVSLEAPDASAVPLDLATSLIEVSAANLGVMMVVTDMAGRPLTEVANPCGWFERHSGDDGVVQACVAEWRTLADDHDLSPRFVTGPLGFDCARAFVRHDHRLIAMVLAGGVAPRRESVGSRDLYQLDESGRTAVLDALPRMAGVLARAADHR
jgi:excisionase family DNA binding protein